MEQARSVLNPSPPTWQEVAVNVTDESRTGPDRPTLPAWGPHMAEFPLRSGGRISIHDEPPTVDLCLHRPVAEECVMQPHLAAAAAALGIWSGFEALHGGAFVHSGRAWALLGDKGAGKSTTLGQLALAGCAVLADDLVIWRDGDVLVGPRCIDLRAEAAGVLGVGRPLGVVGTRERWRLDLPDAPAAVPLAGLIRLDWAEEATLRPLSVAERLTLVLASGALPIPVTPSVSAMELASSCVLSWSRPRDWDGSEDAIGVLLDCLGSK
jgi:hypothetical protein